MLSRDEIKSILIRRGLVPNKALGQNFLVDETARGAILTAALPEHKAILEIGPGLGALTGELSKAAKSVVAVEIDAQMAAYLEETLLPIYGNLSVVRQDFLKFDLSSLAKPFDAVANLPYYITTPAVKKLMRHGADSMTLMMQREAAPRFLAREGEELYGPAAIFASLFYHVHRLLELPPACYFPEPAVHSCVLVFLRKDAAPRCDRRAFLRFAEALFHMRRKTLLNNLTAAGYPKQRMEALLREQGLLNNLRAQELTPQEVISLYNATLTF